MTKLLMKTKHGQQWREKWVSLQDVADWIRTGKYKKWVDAARVLNVVYQAGNLVYGPLAEGHLPLVLPAVGVLSGSTLEEDFGWRSRQWA